MQLEDLKVPLLQLKKLFPNYMFTITINDMEKDDFLNSANLIYSYLEEPIEFKQTDLTEIQNCFPMLGTYHYKLKD